MPEREPGARRGQTIAISECDGKMGRALVCRSLEGRFGGPDPQAEARPVDFFAGKKCAGRPWAEQLCPCTLRVKHACLSKPCGMEKVQARFVLHTPCTPLHASSVPVLIHTHRYMPTIDTSSHRG